MVVVVGVWCLAHDVVYRGFRIQLGIQHGRIPSCIPSCILARMAGRPVGTTARSVHIQFRITPSTAQRIDAMRGNVSRGSYARRLLAAQLAIEEKDATP